MPDAQRAALSAARKGTRLSDETKAKIAASSTGRKHTPEAKEKIAAAKRGRKRPPFSQEWRAKLGAASKGRILVTTPSPSYMAAHKRHLRRWPKTGTCETCGASAATEWSWLHQSRPGSYSDNREDYVELCRSCHRRLDVASYLPNLALGRHQPKGRPHPKPERPCGSPYWNRPGGTGAPSVQ